MTIEYSDGCGSDGTCSGSVDVVSFDSASVTDGNLVADVNDCFDLTVGLRNDGTADATGLTEQPLHKHTGVTVLQGNSDYSDIAQGATQLNSTSFDKYKLHHR